MTLQATGASVDSTQAARAVHVARARTPRLEGRDPRAVPERHDARPARIVRDSSASPKRRGCSSARTSATSRSPKRRRSPASSSRRRRCRRSTTRSAAASAATSCCRRWPTPDYITPGRRRPSSHEPLDGRRSARSKPRRRTSSTTSARRSTEQYPGLTTTTNEAVDVYTTLDLHLQRLAQDAVRDGLTQVDKLLSRRKRKGKRRGGADRRRSADRRDPRDRRRPLVQPVAVQPRHRVAPAAGIGLQAVRLSGGVRAGGARGPHRHHAGDDRQRRAGDVRVRRSGVDAGELRGRVRRPDHVPPRARAVAQPRDDPGRGAGRLRRVAALWKKLGVGTRRSRIRRSRSACSKRRRSRSPRAYTLFPNGGMIRPLQAHSCASPAAART